MFQIPGIVLSRTVPSTAVSLPASTLTTLLTLTKTSDLNVVTTLDYFYQSCQNLLVLPNWSCSLKVTFFTSIHPSSLVRFEAPLIPFVSVVRVNLACWTLSVGICIPFTNPEYIIRNESSRFSGFCTIVGRAYCAVIAVPFVPLLSADSSRLSSTLINVDKVIVVLKFVHPWF